MIVSVPHTGTRSLQRVLGVATIFHFCQNEREFEAIDEPIDFPIRDPLATSISWRCHQSDRTDMDEFRRWETAIHYLQRVPHKVHVVENIKFHEGQSGTHFWWKQALINHDLNALKKLPEVRYLLDWYPTVKEFFEPHYPEGFWWHKKQATPSS